MNEKHGFSGIDVHIQSIQALQVRVIEGQRSLLLRVAERMTDTIRRGKRIFIFGTGHSHMLAEAAFFRAGWQVRCWTSTVSFNIQGAAEHNSVHLEKWRKVNRHL